MICSYFHSNSAYTHTHTHTLTNQVVLLTTNMLRQIDEAFFRRFRFVIEFPAPTATLRASLWEKLLPAKAPLADDIDFARLSEVRLERVWEVRGGRGGV